MKEQIKNQLSIIEEEYNVKILYACESGSRAWGFASRDSDWDVRFLYLHPTDWYLSVDLESKRDVIEMPIENDLDFSGWDLRKAFQLFYKSNPPLMEWLHSPIVYRDHAELASHLRTMFEQFYSPRSCFYHYLHMAKKNYREYLKGDIVWLKKYLYVLRPVLALRWMEQSARPVPVRFNDLLDAVLLDSTTRQAIDQLLVMKMEGMESRHGPAIAAINVFLDTELSRLEVLVEEQEKRQASIVSLNDLFRKMLRDVWSANTGTGIGE